MAEIPTMACPDGCEAGRFCAGDDPAPHYVECERCNGTGRIPRPPLTPDEIAALPDGAVLDVDYKYWPGRFAVEATCQTRPLLRSDTRVGLCRVWLADDDGES